MSVTRRLLLAASGSRWLRERATKTAFVRRSVSAFMPGEHLEDALAAADGLREAGIATMLTRLGENVTSGAEADDATEHYLGVLDRVHAAGLDAQISVKPSQLGLDLDPEVCFRNLERLLRRASARGNFVWIDMEGSAYVDRTLNLFRRARERSAVVGIALQAYLYRTHRDLESLLPLGVAIRLVKGAYLEPPDVAFPEKAGVDENFHRLGCRLLGSEARRVGTLLQIATHDAALLGRLQTFVTAEAAPGDACEYAMLYGVQRGLQMQQVRAGRRVRVLIAYGDCWFPWYMRRLAERPANMWFMARHLFR